MSEQINQNLKPSFEGYSYIDKGKLIGPVSKDKFHAAWESGAMNDYSYVCYSDGKGSHTWEPIQKYYQLAPRVSENEVSHGYATLLTFFPIIGSLLYLLLTVIVFDFGRLNPGIKIFSPENIQTTFKIYQVVICLLLGVALVVAVELDERCLTKLRIPNVNAGFWANLIYPIYLYKRGVHLEQCFNLRWNYVRWMYAVSILNLYLSYRFFY
jgi:hypothetical protein